MDNLLTQVDSAAAGLDAIANNILTYISTKTRRRFSTDTIQTLPLPGKPIEEMLATVVPDAIALDRSRRLERDEQVHIEVVVEFSEHGATGYPF